jgi:hypothetical protein
MTGVVIPTKATTMTLRSHPQCSSSCWSSKLNYFRLCSKSWCKCKMSTNWCNLWKQDPHRERERVIPRMMFVRRRRSMQPERQHPIIKEVSRQLKQSWRVSIVDMLVILPIYAPIDVRVAPLHCTPTYLKLLRMRTKSEENKSATIVDRRVISLICVPTHVLVLLWHYHLLQHHHTTHKPRKRRRNIQKVEDGYDLDFGGYYVEDRFLKDISHDRVIKLVFRFI